MNTIVEPRIGFAFDFLTLAPFAEDLSETPTRMSVLKVNRRSFIQSSRKLERYTINESF